MQSGLVARYVVVERRPAYTSGRATQACGLMGLRPCAGLFRIKKQNFDEEPFSDLLL